MLQSWMATMKSRSGLGVRKALPESKLQKAGDYASAKFVFQGCRIGMRQDEFLPTSLRR